jgi:hypothetical protein
MMINHDEPNAQNRGENRTDPDDSCDRCGRSVSRESAATTVESADGEVTPVCTDCEYGTD